MKKWLFFLLLHIFSLKNALSDEYIPWPEYLPSQGIMLGYLPRQKVHSNAIHKIISLLPKNFPIFLYYPIGLEMFIPQEIENKSNVTFVPFLGPARAVYLRDSLPIPLINSNHKEVKWLQGTGQSPFKENMMNSFIDLFEENHQFELSSSFLEGGNLISNAEGFCITIKRDTASSSDLLKTLGCSSILELDYNKRGIGHADESIKFLSDKVVLTDDLSYKKILESYDFKVFLVPKITEFPHFNYLNSLIVNDSVFIPTLNLDKYRELDRAVERIYSKFFSKVHFIEFDRPDGLNGSLHCISKNIPTTE